LMTAPVSDWGIIAGKFAGAMGFFVCMLAPTLLYVGVLEAIQGGRALGPPLDEPLYALSIRLRIADMARGVIDTSHIVFFGALSVVACVVSALLLESRRWR